MANTTFRAKRAPEDESFWRLTVIEVLEIAAFILLGWGFICLWLLV